MNTQLRDPRITPTLTKDWIEYRSKSVSIILHREYYVKEEGKAAKLTFTERLPGYS